VLRRFGRSGLSKWQIEKRPRRFPVRGAACLFRPISFYSVDGRDVEQVVFAVLLSEEKHCPVFPEFSRPD
jgi:hypothetical protein